MKKNLFTLIVLMAIMVGFLSLTAESCSLKPDMGSNRDKETKKSARNTESLLAKQPANTVAYSWDRYLLNERNTRFNDPNKLNNLYVILVDGTWLKVTIISKLASTSKRLNPTEKVDFVSNGNGYNPYKTDNSDEMGTWGTSAPDKVGMTTLGTLFEIGGNNTSFIFSEVPLSFTGLNKTIIELKAEASNEEKLQLLEKLNKQQKENNEANTN
jgi:hypothetical protein